MARYDAILSLAPSTAVDGWSSAMTPVLQHLHYGCVGTPTGASVKALRSGDNQRPALQLVLILQRQHDHDRLELSLTSSESMVSGARHTRAAFEELLQSLPQQLPGLSIDCRSDTDGPLARSHR
jgi:hypothetical protein